MDSWEPDYFPSLDQLERRCGTRIVPSSFATTGSTWSARDSEFRDWVRRLQRELGNASDRLLVEMNREAHTHGGWAVTLLSAEAHSELASDELPARGSATG